MLKLRSLARFIKQEFAKLYNLFVKLQIALHYCIAHCRTDRNFNYVRITVAEHVYANAVDHVPLNRTICKFN